MSKSQSTHQDRDDGEYSKQASESNWTAKNSIPETPANAVTQDDLINITSCNLEQFGAYMSKQYGAMQFTQGFELIKKN